MKQKEAKANIEWMKGFLECKAEFLKLQLIELEEERMKNIFNIFYISILLICIFVLGIIIGGYL